MGTRCDFYIGKGKAAEWLGSVAWDGNPGCFQDIIRTKSDQEFRCAVMKELKNRDDATLPDDGWPWPWDDSRTTDYAITIFDGKVLASCFGHDFFDPLAPPEDDYTGRKTKKFPDMKSKRQTVPVLWPRSGLIVARTGEKSKE
jgi:hypothetical protein